MAKQQKSRATKVSKGIHGGGGKGAPMTEVFKVLNGGGGLTAITAKKTKRARKHISAKGHSVGEYPEYA